MGNGYTCILTLALTRLPNELEIKCETNKAVIIELSNWKDGIAVYLDEKDRYRSRLGVRVENKFTIGQVMFDMAMPIQVEM